MKKNDLQIDLITDEQYMASTDIEKTIFDLDTQIDMLSNQSDKLDYLVAIASGILCSMIDMLWVGEFDLGKGRAVADDRVNQFVIKIADIMGCKEKDVKSAVAFLEKKFPIPSDGNTPDFGGGLQHHLRDFAHHPTIAGLMFSLLTQFTEKSYGTDALGQFIIVPVPDKSKVFIGTDIPDKIIKGTLVWFFHLVSDIAGSKNTAGLAGGTGIPGPLLAFAKEIATLPLFRKLNIQGENISVYLSKIFNGTVWAQRDVNGKVISNSVVKMDLRGELGIAINVEKQAIPVIANECIVRTFFALRRMAIQLRENNIKNIHDLHRIEWSQLKLTNNPTLSRMLTISSGVFVTIDVAEAIITQRYWVSVNYAGIGRFAVALGSETINFLKIRDVNIIRKMYKTIEKNTYNITDENIYRKVSDTMNYEKLGLTLEQIEILYNLELLKTYHDIENTEFIIGSDKAKELKHEWVREWKHYMEKGFPAFVNSEGAKLHWYSGDELLSKIERNNPKEVWFRLVLLETMLFEPYYALSLEKNKKGEEKPSKKYSMLQNIAIGYKESEADKFLDSFFGTKYYYKAGYIQRLRKCYKKVIRELNEVLKSALKCVAVAAAITIATVMTAGAFAPTIAVALVGSNFAGLSGAALTSACLAYLGGGAIAVGGLGMAGGTMAIVGGGAILGLGVGAVSGGAVGFAGIMGKDTTILQSAKLLVSVREIFLNDEHDIDYSNTIYEQYVDNIRKIETGLVDLKLKADIASKDEKKKLLLEIKNAEESVEAMKIAMRSMNKYKSSFETGMNL